MHIKIIFLDVDGVLNYTNCNCEFSKIHLNRLLRIIKNTNSKIIISSTYKLSSKSILLLWNTLENAGINRKTYCIEKYLHTPDLLDLSLTRTDEIISTINEINLDSDYNITSWVVIDDGNLSDMGSQINRNLIKNHFIKINPKTGLIDSDVERIIEILNVSS